MQGTIWVAGPTHSLPPNWACLLPMEWNGERWEDVLNDVNPGFPGPPEDRRLSIEKPGSPSLKDAKFFLFGPPSLGDLGGEKWVLPMDLRGERSV